jgi:hypothetical protein
LDTLATLRNQVLYWLDEANNTGTTKRNVEYALNQAHYQRCLQFPWKFMLMDSTLTLTAGKQTYSLHQEFERPLYFFNRTTGDYLREMPMRSLQPSGVDWNRDTTGDSFVLWGRAPVENQPAAASVITIVSSSASDTGSTKAIIVRGETADGIRSETITPNGDTPVAGLIEFTRILQVTKSSTWAGTLSITADSGATEVLTLFPSELGRSYQQFKTLWIPQSADVIEYRFTRKPSPLTNDNDIPDIPHPHTQILVWDALKLLLGYDAQLDGARARLIEENQQRAEAALREAELDGQSIGAVPRRIYLDAEDIF